LFNPRTPGSGGTASTVSLVAQGTGLETRLRNRPTRVLALARTRRSSRSRPMARGAGRLPQARHDYGRSYVALNLLRFHRPKHLASSTAGLACEGVSDAVSNPERLGSDTIS